MGQSVCGHQLVNMLSALLLLVILTTSATADKTIEWTITGEAFEECILPGEKLTFEWDNGHNVVEVNQEGYEDCSGFEFDEPSEGNAEFQTSTAGTYYFVCGVGGHCKFGNQKAIVTVDINC